MFKKAVTTELIERYVETMGLAHHAIEEPNEKEGVVIVPLSIDNNVYALVIDPMVEHQLVRFRVNQILTAPPQGTPPDRLLMLLLQMAAYNYQVPLGSFAFDLNDGEVVLAYSLPMNSNDLRFEDFEHVVKMLGAVLAKHAADLKAVVEGKTDKIRKNSRNGAGSGSDNDWV